MDARPDVVPGNPAIVPAIVTAPGAVEMRLSVVRQGRALLSASGPAGNPGACRVVSRVHVVALVSGHVSNADPVVPLTIAGKLIAVSPGQGNAEAAVDPLSSSPERSSDSDIVRSPVGSRAGASAAVESRLVWVIELVTHVNQESTGLFVLTIS